MASHVGQVRLEVDASDVSNLVSNHSAQGGATTGWSADSGITLAAVTNPTRGAETLLGAYTGGKCVRATYSGAAASGAAVYSPAATVVPGAYVGVTFSLADSRVVTPGAILQINAFLQFLDGSSNVLSTSGPLLQLTSGDSPWRTVDFIGEAKQAPAATASARVMWTFSDGGTTKITRAVYLTKLMMVTASTLSGVYAVQFSDAVVWQDVIGSATSVKITRGGRVNGVVDDIEPGLCTAVVNDTTVDPARNTRMRKGRKVRVVALDSTATWRALFTGRIDQLAVDYVDKYDPSAKPTVTVTAVDVIAEMANVRQPFNYAGAYGPKVKALMAADTNVTYVADAGTAATDINHRDRDEGKLWDQLVLARNSFASGQLWVDPDGVLNAVTVTPTGTPAFGFTDRYQRAFTNIVTNPSFEGSITGAQVIGVGASGSLSSGWAERGTQSLLCSGSPTTGFSVDQTTADGLQGRAVLAPGEYASARVAVKAVVAISQIRMRVQEYDGTGAAVGSSRDIMTVSSIAAGAVTVFDAAHVTPLQPTTAMIRFFLSVTVASTTGSICYVDGWCIIKEGSKAAGWTTVPYADTSGLWTPNMTPYTDVEVNYGAGAVVNELSIVLNNDGELEGQKEYGPYRNAASQLAWGASAAQVQAVDGTPSTLAAALLAKWADPTIFPRQLTYRWRDAYADSEFVDLYDEVQVQHLPSGTDKVVCVLGVEHVITPKRWDITLTLRPQDTASITVTNPSAGANTGPDDVAGSPRQGPLSAVQACTANYTVTASVADVTGMTITAEVLNSSEIFDVAVVLDVTTLTTGSGLLTGRLTVDGTDQAAQMLWVAPATVGARTMIAGIWRVTGLTAGNRVFKVRASAATASVYRIGVTSSVLRVSQVE